MHTAPSCASWASSANSARDTRLSREYSVCMCMSSLIRSTNRACRSSRAARSRSARGAASAGLGEREDVDHAARGGGGITIEPGIAEGKGDPRRGLCVDGRMTAIACPADAVERRREMLPAVAPQVAPVVTQLRVHSAGLDHGAQQRRVGSRKDPNDIRGYLVVRRAEGIERPNTEVVLLVHQPTHEFGLVGKLVIEGADSHTRRAADLMNARRVSRLSKDLSCGGQKSRALLLRAALGPLCHSIAQDTDCVPDRGGPATFVWSPSFGGERTLVTCRPRRWSRTILTCSVARSRSSAPTESSPGRTKPGRLWRARPISQGYR